MSRVVYTETETTAGQSSLRETHGLRLVTGKEEGTGANALPDGVYGFTYSPGLTNAPLFAIQHWRNYEVHKRFDGETYLLGFTSEEAAVTLDGSTSEVSIELFPQPYEGATTLVAVPCSRLKQNRHAAPNQESFEAILVSN